MDLQILNLETNENIIFDNKNYILNNILSDDTQVTHSKSKTIKQIGEYINSSSVSSRPINLIGYIIGNSEEDLKNKKNKLLNLINPLQNIRLIANTSLHIDCKAKGTVLWAKDWKENNNQFVKFTISFIAPKTLWKDIEPSIVTFAPYQNNFIFPLFIPTTGMIFGHKTRNKYTTVFNTSNVPLGCKFTLTSLSEVVNPRITNVETGEFMQLNLTLQPNHTLIINTEFSSKSITLDGANYIKGFDFINSKWLMINPSQNTFTYSTENKSEDSLNIELEYYQSYWGVV